MLCLWFLRAWQPHFKLEVMAISLEEIWLSASRTVQYTDPKFTSLIKVNLIIYFSLKIRDNETKRINNI
jgi:hypothetical protein